MKEDFFKKYQNAILKLLRGVSKKLGAKLILLLEKLNVKDGRMIVSASNNRLISKINDMLAFDLKLIEQRVKKVLRLHLNQLFDITKSYFNQFKEAAKFDYSNVKDLLFKDNENLFAFDKIKTIVSDSIKSAVKKGSILKGFIDKIKDVFIPRSKTSIIESKYLKDGGFNVLQRKDRELSNEIAESIGLDHAVYGGTTKNNTRPFCIARINLVYTRKVIKSWDKLKFKGKFLVGHNCLKDCGGYNCRHTLNWITKSLAIKLGKINTYHA